MRRREFIALVGGVAAWPLVASARERMRRIGMLVGAAEGDAEAERWVQTFLQAMQALGWQRDTNVQIDIRWGASNLDRMGQFAKELVALHPDLIQVSTTPATAAILRETRDIPVLFSVVSDPVGSGFVPNLPHPGGNVTGFINIEASLGGKWVQLLKEIAPQVSRVAMLFDPVTAPQTNYYRGSLESASRTLGIAVQEAPFHGAADIEATITALGPEAGLIVIPANSAQVHRETIISSAALHHVPAIYPFRFFVIDGGLASYGVDLADLHRRAATYADRILKGEKPADLPVQLPTKFELAINLKTAKALGLNVPNTLLVTVDEVID
jgi:putative ABC transport system substrate-binding protein